MAARCHFGLKEDLIIPGTLFHFVPPGPSLYNQGGLGVLHSPLLTSDITHWAQLCDIVRGIFLICSVFICCGMWSPPVGSDLFNAFVSESLAWPASHFLLAHSICSKHLWPNYQTAWPHAICSPKREARAILRLQRRVIPALSCFVITIEIFNLGARNMLDQRVKWEIDWIKILKWRVISFPRIARRESVKYFFISSFSFSSHFHSSLFHYQFMVGTLIFHPPAGGYVCVWNIFKRCKM